MVVHIHILNVSGNVLSHIHEATEQTTEQSTKWNNDQVS